MENSDLSKVDKRRKQIAELASTAGELDVEELARYFRVSKSTIRRDLAELERDARITRTYGGALSIKTGNESSMSERMTENLQQKSEIARLALTKIQDGDIIYLDAGSTTFLLAQELVRSDLTLTVITSSLAIMKLLDDSERIRVIVAGGEWRQISQGFVGQFAERIVSCFTFDKVFLGADAVHHEYGLCEATEEQVQLKSMVGDRGRNTYVLADASKMEKTPYNNWAPFGDQWAVITDRHAELYSQTYIESGVALELA